MRTLKLGNAGLEVSALGFGCMGISQSCSKGFLTRATGDGQT